MLSVLNCASTSLHVHGVPNRMGNPLFSPSHSRNSTRTWGRRHQGFQSIIHCFNARINFHAPAILLKCCEFWSKSPHNELSHDFPYHLLIRTREVMKNLPLPSSPSLLANHFPWKRSPSRRLAIQKAQSSLRLELCKCVHARACGSKQYTGIPLFA